MNKQEAIEKINESRLAFAAILSRRNGKSSYFEKEVVVMKEKGLVDIINQIDEPEKPVVPQFVAEWIEENKSRFSSLYNVYSWLGFKVSDVSVWVNENQDIFARAWLDGYEVEKEKRYTARLKISEIGDDNYLNKHSDSERFILSNLYTASGAYQTSFTRSELEEFDVWDNPAFEIKEVE